MNSYQERLDDTSVSLRCYEPAGKSVDISQRDLLGHTLITGGSGAGKTTRAIYPMLEQLIKERASGDYPSHALVIYDTKGDGEMQRFLEDCVHSARRENDLKVASPQLDDGHLEMVSGLNQNIEAIDTFAGLLASTIPRDSMNRYWEMTFESLMRQAIRLHVLGSQQLDYESFTTFMIEYLLKAEMRDPHTLEMLDNLTGLAEKIPDPFSSIAWQVQSMHKSWDTLDYRTKSILKSMASPLIDGLNSPVAKGIFSRGEPIKIADAIEDGSIVLVSIDAVRYPEVARLVGCVLKGQFYDAILARTLSSKAYRPAGLFLDDWLLSATGGIGDRFSDVTALSILRSRGGYLVTGCQSLASLDLTIGSASRRAAFANFANILFFRGRDPELDAFASAYLGQTSQKLVDHSTPQLENATSPNVAIRYEREIRVPSVPVGALARLPIGECYGVIGDRIYNEPLCLIPTFSPKT